MTIKISLTTQLRELAKLCDHYQERNLTLSQAFEEQAAVLKERNQRIAELDSRLQSLEQPAASNQDVADEVTTASASATEEQVH